MLVIQQALQAMSATEVATYLRVLSERHRIDVTRILSSIQSPLRSFPTYSNGLFVVLGGGFVSVLSLVNPVGSNVVLNVLHSDMVAATGAHLWYLCTGDLGLAQNVLTLQIAGLLGGQARRPIGKITFGNSTVAAVNTLVVNQLATWPAVANTPQQLMAEAAGSGTLCEVQPGQQFVMWNQTLSQSLYANILWMETPN